MRQVGHLLKLYQDGRSAKYQNSLHRCLCEQLTVYSGLLIFHNKMQAAGSCWQSNGMVVCHLTTLQQLQMLASVKLRKLPIWIKLIFKEETRNSCWTVLTRIQGGSDFRVQISKFLWPPLLESNSELKIDERPWIRGLIEGLSPWGSGLNSG